MIILTSEDGGKIYIFPQNIKYFEDNSDKQYKNLHRLAKSVVYTIYGDCLYVRDSSEDIVGYFKALMTGQSQN